MTSRATKIAAPGRIAAVFIFLLGGRVVPAFAAAVPKVSAGKDVYRDLFRALRNSKEFAFDH